MSNALTVGSTYQLYTKCESIAGIKVKIVGILAYSEAENKSYNMTTLAINERVISVKDENLEEYIGTDNIYYCRATDANSDGSYSEYICWDGIINFEKTVKINQTYTYKLNLKLLDVTNVPITQVISGIEKYISTNFANTVDFSIEQTDSSTSTSSTSSSSTSSTGITDSQLTEIEAILNQISGFSNKLIPAAEKIESASLSDSIDNIIDKVDTISKNVNIIAQQV